MDSFRTEKADQLSKKIYKGDFSFPFTIEELNLTYKNRHLILHSTVSNIKDDLSQEQCCEIITNDFKVLFNNFIADEAFTYNYKQTLFIENANKNRLNLIFNFNNFLYNFPFINRCTIGYYFLNPMISNINNTGLHTSIINNEWEKLHSFLIATDLKENEFLKFINELLGCAELKVNHSSVTSRDCANSVDGITYNRIEYERGLNK